MPFGGLKKAFKKVAKPFKKTYDKVADAYGSAKDFVKGNLGNIGAVVATYYGGPAAGVAAKTMLDQATGSGNVYESPVIGGGASSSSEYQMLEARRRLYLDNLANYNFDYALQRAKTLKPEMFKDETY